MTRPVTNITRASELIDAGLIKKSDQRAIENVANRYAISIPQSLTALIDLKNPDDPIARQFVPDARELHREPYERDDPIGDDLKSPTNGVVHRYPDRALLKLVNVCPVYCRFCFRRETIGPTSTNTDKENSAQPAHLSKDDLNAALNYFSDHQEIWEVIITGGDPLVLSPRRIKRITDALTQIPHIKVVRWHTRVPVIKPEHITTDLCDALKCQGKAVYIGLHTNHPKELTPEALKSCARLINAGHAMISQTVLLCGVNDDAQTLIELMRKLVEHRVKPYYLHHTDFAPGTAHFRVSIERGQAIMRQLRAQLSGLAQPTYVLDIPGAHGKIPIGPSYLKPDTNNKNPAAYTLNDANNNTHSYIDQSTSPEDLDKQDT